MSITREDHQRVTAAHQAPNAKPDTIGAPKPASLVTYAAVVQMMCLLYGIGSIGMGISLALNSRKLSSADGFTSSTIHPYIAFGLVVIFVGVFVSIAVAMIAEWARLHAQLAAVKLAT